MGDLSIIVRLRRFAQAIRCGLVSPIYRRRGTERFRPPGPRTIDHRISTLRFDLDQSLSG
jgi:hypothetical protein